MERPKLNLPRNEYAISLAASLLVAAVINPPSTEKADAQPLRPEAANQFAAYLPDDTSKLPKPKLNKLK